MRGYHLSEETIRAALSDICAIQVDDEVTLVLVHIVPIREDDECGGYRVAIIAKYEFINTPLKIDITTGDIITPDAVRHKECIGLCWLLESSAWIFDYKTC